MARWIQGVVVATCALVALVAGYFGYNEYSERQALQARSLSLGRLYASARAEPHDHQRVRDYCSFLQRYSRSENAVGKEEAKETLKQCSEFGFL